VPNGSPYRWRASAGRYVDPLTGRFVAQTTVRRWLDDALAAEQRRMQRAARAYRASAQTLSELDAFERAMREGIKNTHLMAAMSANGGAAQMTAADYGRVGRIVRFHYEKLEAWMQRIADGTAPLDGRFVVYAALYAGAARGTHYTFAGRVAATAGMTWEENLLGATDQSCAECLTQTDMGQVPIGTLVPVGQRTCLGNCECTIVYGQD
jgi:hypothetical protein